MARLLPMVHRDAVVAGKQVLARWDPERYTPIHRHLTDSMPPDFRMAEQTNGQGASFRS